MDTGIHKIHLYKQVYSSNLKRNINTNLHNWCYITYIHVSCGFEVVVSNIIAASTNSWSRTIQGLNPQYLSCTQHSLSSWMTLEVARDQFIATCLMIGLIGTIRITQSANFLKRNHLFKKEWITLLLTKDHNFIWTILFRNKYITHQQLPR